MLRGWGQVWRGVRFSWVAVTIFKNIVTILLWNVQAILSIQFHRFSWGNMSRCNSQILDSQSINVLSSWLGHGDSSKFFTESTGWKSNDSGWSFWGEKLKKKDFRNFANDSFRWLVDIFLAYLKFYTAGSKICCLEQVGKSWSRLQHQPYDFTRGSTDSLGSNTPRYRWLSTIESCWLWRQRYALLLDRHIGSLMKWLIITLC